jgi:hypothetical protein
MARDVEHELENILGAAKNGGHDVGVKELKLLKDRNRLLLDVSPLLPSDPSRNSLTSPSHHHPHSHPPPHLQVWS